jgi:hypothetical protein
MQIRCGLFGALMFVLSCHILLVVCDQLSLHLLGGAKGDATREQLSAHWLVPSQMTFENVGVTRGVDPAYRYLTCASCDRGPIGINFFAEPSKFYVAHARVKYAP